MIQHHLDAAVAGRDLSGLPMLDVWDDGHLAAARAMVDVPRDIRAVEALEAYAKRAWAACGPDTMDASHRRRFAEFFHQLGVLPKYKSYGVKYAAPFGYSLFDLENNGGFSVQLHEVAKIEAFHVLATHPEAFVLLCSPQEWQDHRDEFLSLWAAGQPERSSLAYRPLPGDVVVVENLSTVHTVAGCVLEEFATSSYDVVSRLHDQNLGRPVRLPSRHTDLADLLRNAAELAPLRLVSNGPVALAAGWSSAEIPSHPATIVALPGEGLQAWHIVPTPTDPVTGQVAGSKVITAVVLAGSVELDVEGTKIELEAGEVTALAPKCAFTFTGKSSAARVSMCEVTVDIAFADLR